MAKYLKRTGTPGNYRYVYANDSSGSSANTIFRRNENRTKPSTGSKNQGSPSASSRTSSTNLRVVRNIATGVKNKNNAANAARTVSSMHDDEYTSDTESRRRARAAKAADTVNSMHADEYKSTTRSRAMEKKKEAERKAIANRARYDSEKHFYESSAYGDELASNNGQLTMETRKSDNAYRNSARRRAQQNGGVKSVYIDDDKRDNYYYSQTEYGNGNYRQQGGIYSSGYNSSPAEVHNAQRRGVWDIAAKASGVGKTSAVGNAFYDATHRNKRI